MADNKKCYCLKLKDNFFDTCEIKVLHGMFHGKEYSYLLLRMYLMSLRFNGALMMTKELPFNESMISAIADMDIELVRISNEEFLNRY